MNFFEISLFSVIAAAAALLGTVIVICYDGWVRKNSVFLISFAAGVMLTIAFTDLMPEAQMLGPNIWSMVFLGFLVLYVLQNIILFHPSHHEESEESHLGVLSTIGLSLHSLLDGIVISVGFEAGWQLGFLTTMAVILHKMPDGITISGILIHSGTPKRKVFLISTAVAITTPVGAILAYLFLRGISPQMPATLIALTAGSFVYLAASDLLPETHRLHHKANALYFFLGVLLVTLLGHFLH